MDIRFINKQSGGSTLTKVGREAHLSHFDSTMRKRLNSQYKLQTLSVSQAARYFEHCKSSGISLRTLQNRASALRAALSTAGRDHFARSTMTNKALGIAGASRIGTHRPAGPATTAARVATLKSGHAAAAGLQLAIGLRSREALQSGASLNSWERALSRGDSSIIVSHGTKGGRSRVVQVRGDREKMLAAVRSAQAVAKAQGGRLVASKSLAGANRSYQRAMRAAGFKGSEASHSLRCAWAQQRYEEYMREYQDEREALALLSLDLGHGDGRGRYCKSVYLRRE